MFILLDKIRICVPNSYEVTQKLHVILLPLAYDQGKVSRGREMEKLSTPLLFAQQVLSKYTVVQIYHTCICLEQGQVIFFNKYLLAPITTDRIAHLLYFL